MMKSGKSDLAVAEASTRRSATRAYSELPHEDVLGLPVTSCDLAQAVHAILQLANERQGGAVEFLAVNNLVLSHKHGRFAENLRQFDYIFADGAPIQWSVNRGHAGHPCGRITARDTLLALCEAARSEGHSMYFYGSTSNVVTKLAANLREQIPGIQIAGCEPSLFRPLSESEDAHLVERINNSGASLLFLGLGCPLQEKFAGDHRGRLKAVQLCVGSAFKFVSGDQPVPPRWVQSAGMEWLYRLGLEPRRLWRRYLYTNLEFARLLILRPTGDRLKT